MTNAVAEKPFSVLLFDEIEKAHPRVLDKFLQILEDGRLTDGRGQTVHFSETVIIFTSNIGASEADPSKSYSDTKSHFMNAVQGHFNDTLGRPELLNRFGDNIIVFDFITDPSIRSKIMNAKLTGIKEHLLENFNLELELDEVYVQGLVGKGKVGHGGRGLINIIEQEIVNRCMNRETGDRFIEIMRNYEERVKEAGSGFHMNPSPGNVKDGLVTDAIKSAGAARKGGTSPIVDALDYPGWVTKPGLSLLCTAGNDVESTTAMAGAGANMILFSTGLGTPTGNPIAPVVKISSNSKTAEAFSEYVDFDTGPIIDGKESVESSGDALLNQVIEHASGIRKTKSQIQGRDDFLPWKRGMSL